jgi:hypothetical protein
VIDGLRATNLANKALLQEKVEFEPPKNFQKRKTSFTTEDDDENNLS